MSAPLGLIIYAAVKPIIKIYFIIGIGFLLAKRSILTVTTCRDIADLIVTAIMPFLIFNNIVSNLQSSDIKFIGIVFFEGTLLFGVGALLGLATFYLCKSPKAWYGGLISVGIFPNISDLPIAYLQTLAKTGSLFTTEEGDKGVAYVCIFLASQVFYQFSLGLFKLIRYDFRDQLKAQLDDSELKVEAVSSQAVTDSSRPVSQASVRDAAKTANVPLPAEPQPARNDWDDLSSIDSAELEAKLIQTSPYANRPKEHANDNTDTHSHTLSFAMVRSHSTGGGVSRRLMSINENPENPLRIMSSRASVLRQHKSQDIGDLINEYSEFDHFKSHEADPADSKTNQVSFEELSTHVEPKELRPQKIRRYVVEMLKNFLAPNSVSLILSLIIAMAPPFKALFVTTSFSMPNAPDEQPPLSFMVDIASYIGAASVPLGLLVLGATIARLNVRSMPPGFWKTALAITAARLIILPIFGVGLTTGLNNAGWFGDDRLIRFVSVLEFGLPNATALVYFTAFYTDPNSDDHLQMDCLAICLIFQYSILFITLPFLVTFSLKVSLGF